MSRASSYFETDSAALSASSWSIERRAAAMRLISVLASGFDARKRSKSADLIPKIGQERPVVSKRTRTSRGEPNSCTLRSPKPSGAKASRIASAGSACGPRSSTTTPPRKSTPRFSLTASVIGNS
jgi:hypothetical protein